MNDLEAFGDDWVLSGKARSTFETYRQILSRAPFELPGTTRQAKRWLAGRRSEIAPATMVVYVRALRAFSAWWADEYEQPDPLKALEFPKVPIAAPGTIISDTEVAKLRAACDPNGPAAGRCPARDRAVLEMFIHTGMRRSELVALDLTDVDLDAGRIVIAPSKNGEGRIVPIHSDLRAVLKRYLRTERRSKPTGAATPFFYGGKGRLRADSITGLFARLSNRAGLDRIVGTHEFRRRFADQWVAAGGADDHLMVIAGWKSPAMPARYRAANRQDQALAQYQRLLDPALCPDGPSRPQQRIRRLDRR